MLRKYTIVVTLQIFVKIILHSAAKLVYSFLETIREGNTVTIATIVSLLLASDRKSSC